MEGQAARIRPPARHRRDTTPPGLRDAGLPQTPRVAGVRDYALVAAKDGGPAAFVDRREATKLPDTHLKTWESKSES